LQKERYRKYMIKYKIRKSWLISFWISFIFLILSRIAIKVSSLQNIIISSIATIAVYSIPAWITYYLSYKKKGTKWLGLIMFMVYLKLIHFLFYDLKSNYFSIFKNKILFITFYIIFCIYIIICIK